MGFKKVLNALQLFSNEAMTDSTTITSQSVFVQNLDNIGIEWVWTGTPVGTFQISGSMTGINFFPISFASDHLPIPNGSSGIWGTDLGQISWHYLKISYTNTSGIGSLNVWIGGKDVN